jgi:hypothetical protein
MVLSNKTGSAYLSAGKSLFQFFHVILNLREFKNSSKSFIIYPNRKLLFQAPTKIKHGHDEKKLREDFILIIIIKADKPMKCMKQNVDFAGEWKTKKERG